MTKDQLRKFIKDTRGLIRGAAPEKQIKLLKLIKEANRAIAVAEGKKIYKLNIDEIEKDLGNPIEIEGSSIHKNQNLFRYLDKIGYLDLANQIVDSKIEKVLGNKLLEEIKSDDKDLIHVFDTFNNFSTGNNISIGDKVSVITLEATDYLKKNIIVSGRLEPVEVTEINTNHARLENGEIYPKIMTKGIRRWEQVIFFTDAAQAKKCLMAMILLSGKQGDWDVNINLPDGKLSENHDYLEEK